MGTIVRVMVAAGLMVGGMACENGRGETSTTIKTDTKTESKRTDGSKTVQVTTETKTTETRAERDIGVAECDDYLRKMADCSTRVPADVAGPVKEALVTQRKTWEETAATPEGRTALASTCKRALESAKSAYASNRCSF